MFKIPAYKIYHIPHPNDTAYGGVAVIIRSTFPHHELPHYQTPIQAANIQINVSPWPFTATAIYSPQRYAISTEQYTEFIQSLGNKFLIDGDWNAKKNTVWGARLTAPKGRNLLNALTQQNCNYLSTGVPTYWPTDSNRLPDLLDFFINNGVTLNYLQVEPNFEISSHLHQL
jgi:hypothetical protein